jgi:hypothetical protein
LKAIQERFRQKWNSVDFMTLLPIDKGKLEIIMGFGRGLLLWLIGIPIPIIVVIALLMHH